MASRSLPIDLWAPDEQRQKILDSIRRYRAACRKMFSVFGLSQAAGATLTENFSLKPENDRAKTIAVCALDSSPVVRTPGKKGEGNSYSVQSGKSAAYEMRTWFLQELFPSAMSFVWDSARRDIDTAWKARDPKIVQASRGWLALQGGRGLAKFERRGIGFPVDTGRPKLSGHSLILKWDKEIGSVEFSLGNLDGGRYCVWKRLRDGLDGYELGTVYLSERDGKIFATITYSFPDTTIEADPDSVCRVEFGEPGETWLKINGPGKFETDTVSSVEVEGWLTGLRLRREDLERRRAACGNPRKPWGFRRGWKDTQKILSRVTKKRENGAKQRNHAWARRIVDRCRTWKCGKIVVGAVPLELAGHPWGWKQLKDSIKHRADAIGVAVEFA